MPKTTLVITGDWHVRIKPDIPEEWQVNRYSKLVDAVIAECKQRKAVLVLSGDILDRNRPTLLELHIVLGMLATLNAEGVTTYLISGNHESLGLGASTYDYLESFIEKLDHIHYNSSNQIFVPLANDVDLYLVGHPALAEYEAGDLRPGKTNILVSHFRCTVNQFIQEEIDVEKFIAPFDACYASDIHMPLSLYEGKLKYTNHPLNSSFEAEPNCGLIVVEANGSGLRDFYVPLNLPNLIQRTTSADDYVDPPKDGNYYRVEVTGSPEELRKVVSESSQVKLLKVPEVVSEYVAAEETEELKNEGLEEALQGYLVEMGTADEVVAKMMKVYRDA